MKSPKPLTPQQLGHAGQIASLLQSTVASAGNSSDADRQEAAAWWKAALENVITKGGLKMEER